MGKLNVGALAAKAVAGANTQTKAVGVDLFIDSIEKAEPFASLFDIKPEILEAIRADMRTNGFDPSKPVNVWKTAEGRRVLIDGYTRVKAAEELGFLKVTAYERAFTDEAEAVAYAIHTQKDRRNLSDAELFRILERIDSPQRGFKTALGKNAEDSIGTASATIPAHAGNGEKARETSELTAAAAGISKAKVERFRVARADPEEAAAVLSGEKSINQAAKDAKAKKAPAAASSGRKTTPAAKRSPSAPLPPPDKARKALELLDDLATTDADRARRSAWKAAAAIVRKALK